MDSISQPSELNFKRTLDAPLDQVWSAWTDPQEVAKWLGPNGVTNPTCTWEPTPGGKIYDVMKAGGELGPLEGQEWPMEGEFVGVNPKSRLVFKSRALIDTKPILENLVTVELSEVNGKTEMLLMIQVTMTTPEASGPLSGMEAGWTQSVDKLQHLVEGGSTGNG